jgi:hypothetical protein
MSNDRAADPSNVPGDEASALSQDDSAVDDERHYLHDPEGLVENGRDADERAQDDLLELDQTELEELGLVLDDPHQPEPE